MQVTERKLFEIFVSHNQNSISQSEIVRKVMQELSVYSLSEDETNRVTKA